MMTARGAHDSLFDARNTLFLCADPDGKNPFVVRACDKEEAFGQAVARRSVAALASGVVVAVWRLGNFPDQFHASYDREPFRDNHTATGARLLKRPIGRPHV